MSLPKIIGHRGALDLAPENTLVGFCLAAELGVRGVEFDVKLTSDGRCVVFHDDTLDRTTNGRGPVAEADWRTISRLDAGAWFGPEFAGQRVPTLETVIRELRDHDLQADIEIKPSPGRAVETARATMAVALSNWPRDRTSPLVTSFELDCLKVAREAAPNWPRGIICLCIPDNWAARLAAVDASVVVCHEAGLRHADVAELGGCGVTIVAYPVNRAQRAAELVEWGVSSLISNAPDRLLCGDSTGLSRGARAGG